VVRRASVKVKVGPVSIVILLFRGNVTSVLLSLALVVGSTSVEMEISPVCVIVLLFGGDITGVLLAFTLVVRSTGVKMKVGPVCVVILLLDIASILLAFALVVGSTGVEVKVGPVCVVVLFFGSNITCVLLALAFVVAGFKFAAVVLLALALVMRFTCLEITAGKSSNKVCCSDWSTTLVLVSKSLLHMIVMFILLACEPLQHSWMPCCSLVRHRPKWMHQVPKER
jgi:hypothetical protein